MTAVGSEALHVGVIGTGLLGTRIGEEFLTHPYAEVVALADISAESRTTTGRRLAVSDDSQYEDYQTMIRHEDLDAVVVATPHTLHYNQITYALDRGLDILAEKPLVLEDEQAQELLERSRDEYQVIMVGYQRHLDNAFQHVRDRYRSGSLDVQFLTAEITQNWIGLVENTWRADPDFGGCGMLGDTGRHLIDAILWTTGLEPVSVRAEIEYWKPRIDRKAHLFVTFEGGITGTISLFGEASRAREDIHLWDNEGAAFIHGRDWEDRTVTTLDTEGGEYDPYLDRNTERNKAQAFYDAVVKEEKPPATVLDALKTTILVNAAYESAKMGKIVTIDYDN